MPVDLGVLKELREMGAVRVTLHPDGTIAHVDFAPVASPDPPTTQPKMTAEEAMRERRNVALSAVSGLSRYEQG